MEKHEKQVVRRDIRGKLDFNVPILSARRPLGITCDEMIRANSAGKRADDTCTRVPFSWELSAGKPKNPENGDESRNLDVPPVPKLPPGRWQESKDAINGDEYCDYDVGFDGDIDDDTENNQERANADCLSDTIDIFSLAESVRTVGTDDKFGVQSSAAEAEEYNQCIGSPSPNFMIQRFLPDAQALAAVSATNSRFLLPDTFHDDPIHRDVSVRRSYHSPKACGLGVLFPWRMRPNMTPCSLKSPVMEASLRVNPQRGTRERQRQKQK